MALPATDNFNRADANPVGGNWTTTTTDSDCQIVSNQLKGSNATGVNGCYWNADTPGNDQYSEIKIAAYDGTNYYIGPKVRQATGAQTFYVIQVGTGNWRFARFVSGAAAVLGVAQARANSVGDTFRLQVVGITLTCIINGSAQAYTQDDNNIASGRLGIYIRNGNAIADDWAGGEVTTGVSGVSRIIRPGAPVAELHRIAGGVLVN